jgi:hypothetical protein
MIEFTEETLPHIFIIGQSDQFSKVRNFMVSAYFAFASMLISQGKVGSQVESGNTIVTWAELRESLSHLNTLQTEAKVLQYVFSEGSIWRRFYINPNTGAFSAASDENNFPLIQIPINCDVKDTKEIKRLMRDTNRTVSGNLDDPHSMEEISFVYDAEIEGKATVTYITMLWAYAHGSLGAQQKYKNMTYVHMSHTAEEMLMFLRGENGNEYTFQRHFNIPEMNSDISYLLGGAATSKINVPAQPNPFAQSEILIPQGAITHGSTVPASTENLISKTSRSKTSSKRKVFIILLISFLITAPLSNIFAWANIIAIAAMMTKIIISGVGSVIGLGCLVGAIVVGYKNKVCGECCECKCSHAPDDDHMMPGESWDKRSEHGDIS